MLNSKDMTLTKIIDITLPITAELPAWPGSPGLVVSDVASIDEDGYHETSFSMGCHYGTHIDAPSHFLKSGATVDVLPLDVLIGKAYVANLCGKASVTADDLSRLALPNGVERLLIRTDNSQLWSAGEMHFREDFSALTLDGAEWLIDQSLSLVGVDGLSVQRFHDSNRTHEILLSAGVVIVEGLNLGGVDEGLYELICLPLPVVGAEASPARVVLRKLEKPDP